MFAHASINRAYRLVRNRRTGLITVAPENARAGGSSFGGGGTARAARLHPGQLRRLVLSMALGFGICDPGWALDANTLPTGGQVTAGSANIATAGNTMTVNQGSQRAIINWQSFDVGSSASVNFVQPSSSSVALNRVNGTGASQIFGNLNANGQIYLVNSAGILFGAGAQVNVGGLVASTLGISDSDFLAGRDHFSLSDGNTARVVNEGNITANGGKVVLLGASVSNTGQIVANGGNVALAAGRQVTISAGANGHLQLAVDPAQIATLISNGGLIQADGGQIILSAQGANALASAVVSNTGTLQARTIANREGKILLLADLDQGGTALVDGTLDASAPAGGNGGFIETSGQNIKIADSTRVTTQAAENGGGQTGTWLIDPTNFTVSAGSASQTTSGIGATTLSNNLASSNVTLTTAAAGSDLGEIYVNAAVGWNAATKLTLNAAGNINVNAPITVQHLSLIHI